MSEKLPCIRMSVPTYVSYTVGMAYRNLVINTHPKFKEFLNLKDVHTDGRKVQDVEIFNILNLISEGKLVADSDSDSDSDDESDSDSDDDDE